MLYTEILPNSLNVASEEAGRLIKSCSDTAKTSIGLSAILESATPKTVDSYLLAPVSYTHLDVYKRQE